MVLVRGLYEEPADGWHILLALLAIDSFGDGKAEVFS